MTKTFSTLYIVELYYLDGFIVTLAIYIKLLPIFINNSIRETLVIIYTRFELNRLIRITFTS